jgi:cbb3-type cytochrome oxidase subunit 1
MQNLGINFVRCAVIYGLLGMVLGIVMAASGDHGQAPTHAHINLVGWASMGLFGLAYKAWPELNIGVLPRIHFWGWNLGVLGMVIGLFLMFSRGMEFAVITAVSSVIIVLSMLVFAVLVFRAKVA